MNLFIHLSFRQGGDWKWCCGVGRKKHLYKIKCIIIPIALLQRIRHIMRPSLPIGYLPYSSLSKQKPLYLTCFSKMSRNVQLCSCRKQSLPYCCLKMIYNWANNSLTSKGYEQNVHTWLHEALALISKQAHLLTTTAVNSPDHSQWHRYIWQWSICILAYCSSDWLCRTGLSRVGVCQCNRIQLGCILPRTTSLA